MVSLTKGDKGNREPAKPERRIRRGKVSLQARLCPLRGMKSAFLMYQHNYPTGAKLNVNKPDSALYMETFPEDDRTSGTNKNHVQQNFPSCTITASIWGTTNNESERNM